MGFITLNIWRASPLPSVVTATVDCVYSCIVYGCVSVLYVTSCPGEERFCPGHAGTSQQRHLHQGEHRHLLQLWLSSLRLLRRSWKRLSDLSRLPARALRWWHWANLQVELYLSTGNGLQPGMATWNIFRDFCNSVFHVNM